MAALTLTPGRRPRWWLRILVLAVAAVAAMIALDGRLPDPAAVATIASSADLRWVALAVLAQIAAQTMFARQQRLLLSAFAVDMSIPRALAITYSRTAISMALPAGSAVSAAFAFQQYRRRGASSSTAATVAVLSGVAGMVGLILLYATGLLTAALAQPWTQQTAILAGSALLVVGAGFLIWFSTRSSRAATPPRRPAANRVLQHVAAIVAQARALPARHWAAAIGFSAVNWLLDVACLAAVAHACHLTLDYGQLAGIYLAAQIARQIPITPGGIGLIETSLLAGLISVGAPQTSAAAVVLGYRLISFWLILPIGLATYLALHRAERLSDRAVPMPRRLR